jgi:hypothetical protein
MVTQRYVLTSAHFERAPIGAAAEADIRVEAAPSNFDVARAMTAYIPLLKACYARAHEQPVVFPKGYEAIAEVRADATEAEAGDAPEVKEAVRNDVESAEAGLADPQAFGYVVREAGTNHVLVCIRGTQTAGEWAANFTAVPNPFSLAPSFGLVHLGFERMERRVRRTIEQGLEAVAADTRITVVGHSLGGAMAILAAVDVKLRMGKSNVDVCTFGGPRVGKFIFRHQFNRLIPESYRVSNQGDIVPHVPPLVTGWCHIGEEIEVDGNIDHPHGLDAYLEGLRTLGTVRELAPLGTGAEAAITSTLSVRVP